jgi:hypothetical protein
MTPQQLAWRAAHYTPWYERIGDEGAGGWLIAVAYLSVTALCLLAARKAARETGADRPLWLLAGAALCLLAINKQLDLQLALIEGWREIALSQGWYGARRGVQLAAFAGGLAGGAAALAWLAPRVWRGGRPVRWGFAGMTVIGIYVTLRAAKFQHVLWDDPSLRATPGWVSLLEIGGIAIVAAAAAARLRRG